MSNPQQEPSSAPVKPVIPAAAAKRANASVIGMVISLVVTFAVLLPVVLLNAFPKAETFHRNIDVAAVAAQAGDSAGFQPVAPSLPDGWSANYARWNTGSSDGVPNWEVGYATAGNHFVSLTQTNKANPTWLSQRTNSAPVTGTRTAGGKEWELRDKPGADKSLVLAYKGTTLILTGDADLKEFDVLAAAAVRSADAGSPAKAGTTAP